MNFTNRGISSFVLMVLLLLSFEHSVGQNPRLLADLSGKWKIELGDDMRWASTSFDDGKWESIRVPSSWEEEGFPGYDGYAWYRKHFTCPKDWSDKDLLLYLGTIDDVDEVYVNGQFLAFQGAFPPRYITAYSAPRQYPLPWSVLKPGADNVIAVRVYDDEQSGGILSGKVGVYERRRGLRPDLQLPAEWKFRSGDDPLWSDPDCEDRDWQRIRVPSYWETQGHKDYDGFGWYRVRFTVPSGWTEKSLVLLLGKIDDVDETYLNGQRIGRMGSMPRRREHASFGDEYTRLRAYRIPSGLLKSKGENVLAVRVYDGFVHGGIYDGPIGIVTRDRYYDYKEDERENANWFQRLMDDIFRDR